MFRFFAVVLVIGAFVGALYFSGNALEAWESPKPEPVAMPKPKKQRKPKRHAQPVKYAKPVKKAPPTKPSWLVELNAACRRGKRESESIPRPSNPQELAYLLRKVTGMNARINRETAGLVSRSGNAKAATQLRALYAQDETFLHQALTASERGQYERLPRIARSLLAVGRAENKLFARLGAGACTVSPDELQF
jgi:type IV secretory pathway VirB10-like protein